MWQIMVLSLLMAIYKQYMLFIGTCIVSKSDLLGMLKVKSEYFIFKVELKKNSKDIFESLCYVFEDTRT